MSLKRQITYKDDYASSSTKRARSAIRKILAPKRMPRMVGKGYFKNGRLTVGNSGPETKMRDLNVGETNVGFAAPYVSSVLKSIAQGDGISNRDGQTITVKSLDVKLNVEGVMGATAPLYSKGCFLAFFILLDTQPNGTEATTSDVFTLNNTDLTFGYTPNLARFQVLRQDTFALDPYNRVAFKQYHVPLEVATRFSDGTGVPQTNDILIAALSTGPATNTLYFDSRISVVARPKWQDN